MRSLLKLVFVLSLAVPCFGQGGSVVRQVIAPTVAQNGTGQPASYALIRVCTGSASGFPCSPLVSSIYADQALTQSLPSAFAADVNGNYSFFVPSGEYLVQESNAVGAGYSFQYSWLIFANGTGTVSSVGLSMPASVFNISGPNPITGAGSFLVTFNAQPANQVFGNCSTGTAIPGFCPLTAAMIPATLNATTINGLTVNGNETVSGTLGVAGAVTLSSTLAAQASTLFSLSVTNNASVAGNLGVTGNETVGGTLSAGASTLASLGVAGNATVGGTLSVSGNTTLLGALAITGDTSTGGYFNAAGAITSSTSLTAPFVNVTTGYQIGGSYGTSGDCILSTGLGSVFSSACGIGGIPVVSLGTGAGTGAYINTAAGTDKMGFIAITAGTAAPSSSAIINVTFGHPFTTFASCTFSPSSESSGASPGSLVYIYTTLNGFALYSGGTGLSNVSYQWSYLCNGY